MNSKLINYLIFILNLFSYFILY